MSSIRRDDYGFFGPGSPTWKVWTSPTALIGFQRSVVLEHFDPHLAAAVAELSPSLVVLAGFMRILSAEFIAAFEGRILNIHPSLLPKYPGLHTHRRVLEARDTEHGATVHFVTEALDAGRQRRIAIAAAVIDIGDFLAAPGVEITLEDVGGEVVIARHGVDGRGHRGFLPGHEGYCPHMPTAKHYADAKNGPQWRG